MHYKARVRRRKMRHLFGVLKAYDTVMLQVMHCSIAEFELETDSVRMRRSFV